MKANNFMKVAINEAKKGLKEGGIPRDYRNSILYSTLSPCDMCSGTILLYKIPKVVIGENKTFKGPEDYLKRRGVRIINLDLEECKNMMKEFIKKNTKLWNEDIGKL